MIFPGPDALLTWTPNKQICGPVHVYDPFEAVREVQRRYALELVARVTGPACCLRCRREVPQGRVCPGCGFYFEKRLAIDAVNCIGPVSLSYPRLALYASEERR